MDGKCFAELDGSMCDATDVGVCLTYDCPFYTTEKQHKQNIRHIYARLRDLPPARQKYISQKYFKGKMPWNK